MQPTTLTTLDVINLIAAATSIILGVFAIILSLIFFVSAVKSGRETDRAVSSVKEATDTLQKLSIRLIGRLTTALIEKPQVDKSVAALTAEADSSGSIKSPVDEPGRPNLPQTEQFRVDNLIAALYYAGVSNIALSKELPANINEIKSVEGVANLVDQSYVDYHILKRWIHGATDYESKIEKSPVKHLYDQIVAIEHEIKSVRDHYADSDATPS